MYGRAIEEKFLPLKRVLNLHRNWAVRDQHQGLPGLLPEVATNVLQKHRLRAHARVLDAGEDPAAPVADSQKVHDLRLADVVQSFHGVLMVYP